MAVLLTAGCGGGGAATSPSDQPPPTEVAQTGGGTVAAEDLKLALVLGEQGNAFYQQVIQGAEDAAKEFGVDLQVTATVGADPPGQVKLFQDVIAAGAKGVVFAPYDVNVWRRPLQEAADEGIALIVTNLAAPGTAAKTFVGENSVQMGAAVADLVLDQLGDNPKGKVILATCAPGLLAITLREQGIREEFAVRAPDVKLEGPFNTGADPTTWFGTWESLMQANQDALGYIDICYSVFVGQAKEKSGFDQPAVGPDIPIEALQLIEKGVLTGGMGQHPYLQGYVPIRLLVEHFVNGKPLPDGWIDIGLDLVTAENVGDILAREESLEATQAFYAPIIEKIFADTQAAARPLGDLLSRE